MHHRFDVIEACIGSPHAQVGKAIVDVLTKVVRTAMVHAGVEAIDAHDVHSRFTQRVHDVGTDKPGAAGHQDLHRPAVTAAARTRSGSSSGTP